MRPASAAGSTRPAGGSRSTCCSGARPCRRRSKASTTTGRSRRSVSGTLPPRRRGSRHASGMRETKCRELIAALGVYVRDTRQLLGWSQQTLADTATTSQGLVSRLESGRCAGLPLMSALKILVTLGNERAAIVSALPPPVAVILACAAELEPDRSAGAPDPNFRKLLQTYHRLPAIRQAAFIRMMLTVASMLEDVEPIGEAHDAPR